MTLGFGLNNWNNGVAFYLNEVDCRWTGLRGGGKISSYFEHVNFEMPFYIQNVKEAVEYKSLNSCGEFWAGCKFGSIFIYVTFRAKLRLYDIIKIMSMEREERDFKD